MECFLVGDGSRAISSRRRRILGKATLARGSGCVRKTTRKRRRARARGFVHEAALQRRIAAFD